MGLPVDTANAIVICGGTPEAMVDRRSGERRTNAEGVPLWRVWLVLIGDDEPVVMRVKTTTEPRGLVKGQRVAVANLVASSWTSPEGKEVDLYNAAAIEPARATKDGAS